MKNLTLSNYTVQTIAFYIRNTSFFNNYIKPYSDVLLEKGHKVIILHTNSLTQDLSKEKINDIEIESYDLGKNSIKSIIFYLKSKNIEAVVSINFHSPMDLLVNRLLNYIKIKSVYMEHGILPNVPGKYIAPPNKWNSIKRLSKYFSKYISFTFVSGKPFNELNVLFNSLVKKQYSLAPYNHYLLYAPRSYKTMSKVYNMDKINVEYSGYPIQITDNTTNKTTDYIDKNLLYIHQPYVFHKIGDCTYQDEFFYLKSLGDIAKNAGYKLSIKLHPLESENKYKNALENNNIIISDKNLDLSLLVNNSTAVLGHYSTALFVALKLNKPIIQVAPKCFNKNINFKFFEKVSLQAYSNDNLFNILKSDNRLFEKIKYYPPFFKEIIGNINSYEHRILKLLELIKIK